ncbi:MAG: hypothetical protein LBJ08_03290, partial [Bifidobacteriaceae bacterium]|nr:hypothetical protein [Bifidobacteriaceae bacterium]
MKRMITIATLCTALAIGLVMGAAPSANAEDEFRAAPREWGSINGSVVNAGTLADVAASLKVTVVIDCIRSFGAIETISTDPEQIARWRAYLSQCLGDPTNYGQFGGGEAVVGGGSTSWSVPGIEGVVEDFRT